MFLTPGSRAARKRAPASVSFPIRTKLTADKSYYVDNVAGSDSNDGSAIAPFATLQHAWDYLSGSLDLGQSALTINLAASATGYVLTAHTGWIGGSAVNLLGTSAATTTISQISIWAASDTPLYVDGVLLGADAADAGIQVLAPTVASVGKNVPVEFGTVNWAHISAIGTGAVINPGAYTIAGSAVHHLMAGGCGIVNIFGAATNTLTGTPDFSTGAFAEADGVSVINIDDPVAYTYSGAATGPRFGVTENGVIAGTSGVSYFPGSTAGTCQSGGQYAGTTTPIDTLQKAGAPTTADVPDGQALVVHDTVGATVKLYYNNGGVLMSVALV